MRQRFVPTDLLVVGAATVLALVLALVLRNRLLDPPPGAVGVVLVLPPVALLVVMLLAGRRPQHARSPWWRLITLGYLLLTVGLVARSVALPLGPVPAGTLGALLCLWGMLCLMAGVTTLELSRGSRHLVDLVVDVVMLSTALLLLLWCVVARPRLDRGALGGAALVDVAVVAVCAVLVASLASAAIAGYLWPWEALWGTASVVVFLAGCVCAVVASGPGGPPLAARMLWSLSPAYVLPSLSTSIRTPVSEQQDRNLRWNPVAPAAACFVPIGLYVAETVSPPAGAVPDAVAIGSALILLCIGCMARVVRSVSRAELQSHLLEDMARSDHLTGLANRRTADEELRRAFARAPTDDEPVAVALCDLDHFKAFNDRFGHHAGDDLLIGAAQSWTATLGDRQLLARYGGEEFLVVSTGLAASGLAEVVDRMRRATPRGQTFSAGIAAWDGVEDVTTLVARADSALYEAKENGRARTAIAYTQDPLEATP